MNAASAYIDLLKKPVRECGGCTLCCKLVPVAEVEKAAGQRCRHQQTGKGCRIYASRPMVCRFWNCAWIMEENVGDMRRPDRSRYVIDCLPDFVTLVYEGEEPVRIPVIQVWCDPAHPLAHRDPALRAYLARRGEEEGMAAIIRYDSAKAFVLFPPALARDGEWHENHSGIEDRQHSAAEVYSALDEARTVARQPGPLTIEHGESADGKA